MLNSFTVLLKRGNHTALKMIPVGAGGVWGREMPDVVLLDSNLIRNHIETRRGDLSWLFVDGDKIHRLQTGIQAGMQDLDMPIYSLTGNGHSDDLEIEQGRHRTFVLISSFGVDFIPVLVPGSIASKLRKLFGYRKGYLTQTEHLKVLDLKPVQFCNSWYIGTDLEPESVESFGSMKEAEEALYSGHWNERPTIGFGND